MKKIEINTGEHVSRVLIGEKLASLGNYLPEGKKVIITDENIRQLYQDQFPAGIPVIEMGLGEKNKTMDTLEHIYSQFVELEMDRSSFVIAIGGGIVCDVAGFAASTFMRGLKFGFVSTSLLSQVDASVGGKNGVNFQGYKNMIGVFNQPDFVICDVEMLSTLKKEEFISGFAEIVKAGAIRDANLFGYLEQNVSKALGKDQQVLEKIIHESVQMKAGVVTEDEREKGLRRILNLGHTFAHSFEKYGGILHGQAVSIGMVLAAKLSVKKGLLDEESANRIERLLEAFQLPVKMNFDPDKIIQAMLKDKKRRGDVVALVLLNKIGEAVIEDVPVTNLKEIVYDLC